MNERQQFEEQRDAAIAAGDTASAEMFQKMLSELPDPVLDELSEEAALDVPKAEPPALDIPVPEVAEPAPAPVADVKELVAKDNAFKELGQIVAEETTPEQHVTNRAKQRREARHARMGIEDKPDTPLQGVVAARNKAFVELGNIVREEPGEHADRPVAVEMPPEDIRKVGELGGEKENLNAALGDFLKELKALQVDLREIFAQAAKEIAQQRKELDDIRGLLERTRE